MRQSETTTCTTSVGVGSNRRRKGGVVPSSMHSLLGLSLCLSLAASACGDAPTVESTIEETIDAPDVVVRAFVDALIDEEFAAAGLLVDERHMAFLVAIEHGTSGEVAGMLRSGVPLSVRVDYWRSFADSLPAYSGASIGRIRVSGVTDQFSIGGEDFATVDLAIADGKAEWILRRTPDGWVIDLLATFGTGFLQNLRGWFVFISADDEAAYVRAEFKAEIPSLMAGLERLPLGPLPDSAREAADGLLADFGA